ncbi:hypothetical protein FRB99_009058 [Tulasnella sp. 403]|nr:hypothetical protein FRB99_009058 [Tulasnella sp. 403]
MLSVSTWHPPSAVSHSLKCKVTSASRESLVVAKVTLLEIYDLTPNGLELRCSFYTWGTVTSLASTRLKQRGRLSFQSRTLESLIVTTDHPSANLYILNFDTATSTLFASITLPLRLRAGREAEFFNGAILHPNGKVIVAHAYSGTIKVIVLGDDVDKIETEFDCRIPELNVHSLCFIPASSSKLILAVLSEDHNGRMHVVARELKLDEQELSYEHSSALAGGFAQNGASLIIPINGSRKLGGILVVGGGSCHFFGSEKAAAKRSSVAGPTADKLTAVHSIAHCDTPLVGRIAYATVDENRFLLGDSRGQLCLLLLERTGPGSSVSTIYVTTVGQVSPCASITYIDSAIFYVGSLLGDSQTIRVLPSTRPDGSHVEILQHETNIGPILDAVLTDVDSSGQYQVVTCSGSSTSGSLRVIRSGVEFRTSSTLEGISNVDKIFTLQSSFSTSSDSVLLLSTPFSTLALELNKTSLDELDTATFPGIVRSKRTLTACTLAYEGRSVQVTTDGVYIIDMLTGAEVERWPSAGSDIVRITTAAANPTQVCIALEGGKLLYLSTIDGVRLINEMAPNVFNGLPNEISCLAIDPHTPGSTSSTIVAVGYWARNTVTLYNLPHFTPLASASNASLPLVEETHAPRSLMLYSFQEDGNQLHLLVGLGDGSVVTFAVTPSGLFGRRSISLSNHRAVSFTLCSYHESTGGDRAVLACGARGTVFWFDRKTQRVKNTYLLAKDVDTLTAINHPAYPESVLLVSGSVIEIGTLREVNKLNIQTIPLGTDNPERLAYHPGLKVLAVGCKRTELNDGEQLDSSFVKILDATSFDQLHQIRCQLDEEVTSISTLEVKSSVGLSSYIVVGTAMVPPPGDIESQHGRVLVLDGSEPSRLRIAAAIDVSGCVYSLAALNGMIAAAVNSFVFLYSLEKPSDKDSFRLVQRAKWDRGYLVTALASRGDVLYVANTLKSIEMLKLEDGKLVCVAQNCDSLWPLSVESISEDLVIDGELDFNISLMKRSGQNLELVGGFHYGEQVNRFVLGSISKVSDDAKAKPKMLMVTPSGRISVISDVSPDASFSLTALQRNMGYVRSGPGGAELSTWRTPRTSRGNRSFVGFIDGDFVGQFLDLSEAQKDEVLAGRNEFERLKATKDELLGIVEQVTAIH